MHWPSFLSRVAPAATLAVLACNGGDLALPTVSEVLQMELELGDGQTARPGQTLGTPLKVQLVDEAGEGVPNVAVTWTVTGGGGTITPINSTSDPDGFSSALWTLGPSEGLNTAVASVAGVGLVTFTATAQAEDDGGGEVPGGGGEVPGGGGEEPGGGGEQPGGGGEEPGGGGEGPGGGENPDDGGEEPGGGGEDPDDGGEEPGGGGEDPADVPSAGLSSVSASPASIMTGTGTSTITVTVRDQSGARLSGATVSLVASGNGVRITQPSGPTNIDGVATGTLRSTEPGIKEVRAVVNGSVQIAQVARVSVARAVHHLEFLVQPRDVREDEEFTVRVALVDADGNIVPLSGIEIYVDLFRAGKDKPDNTRALGDRFRDTVDGVATFELRVINGSGGGPAGRSEDGYRLRALTDELPEGQGGPKPYLFSIPFDVEAS